MNDATGERSKALVNAHRRQVGGANTGISPLARQGRITPAERCGFALTNTAPSCRGRSAANRVEPAGRRRAGRRASMPGFEKILRTQINCRRFQKDQGTAAVLGRVGASKSAGHANRRGRASARFGCRVNTPSRPVPSSSIKRRSSPCQRWPRARLQPSTTAFEQTGGEGQVGNSAGPPRPGRSRNSQPRSSQRKCALPPPSPAGPTREGKESRQKVENQRMSTNPSQPTNRFVRCRAQGTGEKPLGKRSWRSSFVRLLRAAPSSATPPAPSTAAGLGRVVSWEAIERS